MINLTEAQLMQWLAPLLWPMLRTLSLIATAPVLSMRNIPVRVKVGLAFLVALSAQASLPEMPIVPLDGAQGLAMVAQQVLIGVLLGFSARIVFAALEFAGELIGLQMGLNRPWARRARRRRVSSAPSARCSSSSSTAICCW
jgi:flagellar biosynthesis protein FliR